VSGSIVTYQLVFGRRAIAYEFTRTAIVGRGEKGASQGGVTQEGITQEGITMTARRGSSFG